MRRSARQLALPKRYRDLPASSMGAGKRWGNVSKMSQKERTSAVKGEWRERPEMHAVADPADRDAAFSPAEGDLSGGAASVQFRSEEEALETMLEDGSHEIGEETVQGLLEAAASFHEQVASMTDDDVDPTSTAERMTDEDRLLAKLAANREFFEAFYEQQGIVEPYKGKYLTEAMLVMPSAVVTCSSPDPLVRMTTSMQLVSSRSAVPIFTAPDTYLMLGEAIPKALRVQNPALSAYPRMQEGGLTWLQRHVATGSVALTDVFGGLVVPELVKGALEGSESKVNTIIDWTDSGEVEGCTSGFHQWSCDLVEHVDVPAIVSLLPPEANTFLHRDDARLHPNVALIKTLPKGRQVPRGIVGDVVVVAPASSCDGARPTTLLGGSGTVAVNDFIDRATKAVALHDSQVRRLAAAINLAVPVGGTVIYVTNSMNPIENEAVVAAVLSENKNAEVVPTPEGLLREEHYFATQQDGSEEGLVAQQQPLLGRGLSTWVEIDGAPDSASAAAYSDELRGAIAETAIRASPTDHTGGGFAIALKCTTSHEGKRDNVAPVSSVSLPFKQSSLGMSLVKERSSIVGDVEPQDVRAGNVQVGFTATVGIKGFLSQLPTMRDVAAAGVPISVKSLPLKKEWLMAGSARDDSLMAEKSLTRVELPIGAFLALLFAPRVSPAAVKRAISSLRRYEGGDVDTTEALDRLVQQQGGDFLLSPRLPEEILLEDGTAVAINPEISESVHAVSVLGSHRSDTGEIVMMKPANEIVQLRDALAYVSRRLGLPHAKTDVLRMCRLSSQS